MSYSNQITVSTHVQCDNTLSGIYHFTPYYAPYFVILLHPSYPTTDDFTSQGGQCWHYVKD
jgi:hypothetical protein